jgi:hypothetical protein
MNVTPEFWTPQELTEEEINKICDWLMAWQKASVMAQSLMGDDPLTETLAVKELIDPALARAMHHVESLIRHLHALKLKEQK